jgi:hypothetical protein
MGHEFISPNETFAETDSILAESAGRLAQYNQVLLEPQPLPPLSLSQSSALIFALIAQLIELDLKVQCLCLCECGCHIPLTLESTDE